MSSAPTVNQYKPVRFSLRVLVKSPKEGYDIVKVHGLATISYLNLVLAQRQS